MFRYPTPPLLFIFLPLFACAISSCPSSFTPWAIIMHNGVCFPCVFRAVLQRARRGINILVRGNIHAGQTNVELACVSLSICFLLHIYHPPSHSYESDSVCLFHVPVCSLVSSFDRPLRKTLRPYSRTLPLLNTYC